MKHSIIYLFYLIPCLLFGQTKQVLVQGYIRDVSNIPLQYIIVQNSGTADGYITDAMGNYKFFTKLPIMLRASFLGYETVVKKISPDVKGDTIEINFVMKVDSSMLQEVTVTAIHDPVPVRESTTLMDFETNQHKLWLLYHYKGEDHLEVYDSNINYLTRTNLNKNSTDLFVTPHRFLCVSNSDSVRLIQYHSNDNIISFSAMQKDKFRKGIKYLKAFGNYTYFYSWNSLDSGIIRYWYYSAATKKQAVLYAYKNVALSIENDTILTKMREYNYTLRGETGIPPSMTETGDSKNAAAQERNKSTGHIPSNFRERDDDIHELNMLVRNIYCPIRLIRDSIYIFNFDNDSIYIYNMDNRLIRQTPLAFSGLNYHDIDIIVNEEGDEAYFKFAYKGDIYLRKIDLNTGSKMNTQKVGLPFPEKLRIMSGYVYYTTSGVGENEMFIRHLYRQKL